MVNRCQSCGLHFNDGPPPLEALSPAQAELVGVEYGGDPENILCEALKDLSVYNFCSVCIRFARYQLVWENQHTDPDHQLVHGIRATPRDRETNPTCSCGHHYNVPTERRNRDRWIWINRAIRLHRLEVYYPDVYVLVAAQVDLDAEV